MFRLSGCLGHRSLGLRGREFSGLVGVFAVICSTWLVVMIDQAFWRFFVPAKMGF
jgi:hypothetical protein